MANKLTVLVVRAGEELTDEFKNRIQAAHPGREIDYIEIDPRNADEAAEAVEMQGGEVITVVRQDPLIKKLLDRGVPIIPIMPGALQQLVGFTPKFVPYQP